MNSTPSLDDLDCNALVEVRVDAVVNTGKLLSILLITRMAVSESYKAVESTVSL